MCLRTYFDLYLWLTIYILDYSATPHNVIRWQADVKSATVVVLYFVKVPGAFDLNITTDKCTYMNCVYHMLLWYQHLSNIFAVIIVVVRRITRSPNKLLKCISESLTVSKHVSYFLHSHSMSVYYTTASDKIQLLLKLGILLYVVNLQAVIKLIFAQLNIRRSMYMWHTQTHTLVWFIWKVKKISTWLPAIISSGKSHFDIL